MVEIPGESGGFIQCERSGENGISTIRVDADCSELHFDPIREDPVLGSLVENICFDDVCWRNEFT